MPKKSDDLLETAQDSISDYATRDALFDELEDYYFLEQSKESREEAEEEGIEIVRLPMAANVVDLVQDLLGSVDFTVSVPAMGEQKKYKELADTAEQYLQSVWQESERQQNVRLTSRAAWLVAMRGCLCGRVVPRPVKKGAKAPKGKADDVRLQVQLRDPRYVYPRFGADGLSVIVESWKRPVHDIRQTVGKDLSLIHI